MTLGERVKARREQIGMTQEELARKMGYKSMSPLTRCGTLTAPCVQRPEWSWMPSLGD